MYAMRYGTIPIVHATGGLRDTVEPYKPFENTGTGWQFTQCNADGLKAATWEALQTYWLHKESWQQIMRRGMEKDLSWGKAAEKYEQICHWARIDAPYSK